jgi:hypothetical protein
LSAYFAKTLANFVYIFDSHFGLEKEKAPRLEALFN